MKSKRPCTPRITRPVILALLLLPLLLGCRGGFTATDGTARVTIPLSGTGRSHARGGSIPSEVTRITLTVSADDISTQVVEALPGDILQLSVAAGAARTFQIQAWGEYSGLETALYSGSVQTDLTAGETTALTIPVIHNTIITLHANGGTPAAAYQGAYPEAAINLMANPFVRQGYRFQGWALAPDGAIAYRDGGLFSNTAGDITLYAKWGSRELDAINYRGVADLPAGTYTQQNTAGDSFTHTLSPFSIARYEATYELWHTVYQWALTEGYTFANAGQEGHDGSPGAAPTSAASEPVTGVSWYDAVVWCNAYSEMAGYAPVYRFNNLPLRDATNSTNINSAVWESGADGYRLPTEGEWQYAASYIDGSSWTSHQNAAGDSVDTTTADSAGTLGDYGWYTANGGAATHPVGLKNPAALELYDLSGNVYEWCWDRHGNYPVGAQTDYRGPGSGTNRVLKSCYYESSFSYMQIGFRPAGGLPGTGRAYIGFRPVRTP